MNFLLGTDRLSFAGRFPSDEHNLDWIPSGRLSGCVYPHLRREPKTTTVVSRTLEVFLAGSIPGILGMGLSCALLGMNCLEPLGWGYSFPQSLERSVLKFKEKYILYEIVIENNSQNPRENMFTLVLD